VIQPTSPEATFDSLIKSKSEVFQWSTCHIIETTGDLGISLLESSSVKNEETDQSTISSIETQEELLLSNFISKLSEIIAAVSKSTLEFMFTITQFFINSAISFGKTTQIFSDNSFIDKKSGTITVSHFFSTKFCLISSICFSSFFIFCNLFDLIKVTSSSSINFNFHLVLANLLNFCFLNSSSASSFCFFHFVKFVF
jgi:hypothetical protein